MGVEIFAPAKINLCLHVTGQRGDGYHLLDSLVVFADLGDVLVLREGAELDINVAGKFAHGVPTDSRNIAWQAALIAGWTGHISIEKNLPHGAGIGGGSADAAAILSALGATDSGAVLGADVPVCKHGGAARVSGIGEHIEPVRNLPKLFAVLVNPNVHVPTPRVFSELDQKNNAALPGDFPTRDWFAWLSAQRNDLEQPAIMLQPVIEDVLKALSELPGQRLVRMSGSGATCFALFDNAGLAEIMARELRDTHPGWWVETCTFN